MIFNKNSIYNKVLFFQMDNILAQRLETVTEELWELVPNDLRIEFDFSKLCEITFAALLEEYEEKSEKKNAVLAQIVMRWSDDNENLVEKNIVDLSNSKDSSK